MRFVAVLVLVVVLVAACTPDDGGSGSTSITSDVVGSSTTDSAGPTTTIEPPDGFGGEVTVGVDLAVETLNPFAPNAFDQRLAGNAIWAMVYDIDPETWDRVPDVVTSLPSDSGAIEVNDDGTMTVRYEIRRDAVWSDGTPISGEDLAFTAEAMREMAAAGEGGVDPVMASVVGTDAVEQLAFITFAQPTLAFEDALWIVLPKHALDGVDLVDGTDGSDWPSGGPFVVDEFIPLQSVRFVRNARYWKTDGDGRRLPHLDALTISGVGDEPTSPIPRFLLRDLDVAVVSPDADAEREGVEAAAGDGAILEDSPSPIIEYMTFGFSASRDTVNPESLNDSLEYRVAVAEAIDREGILDETDVPWSSTVPGLLNPIGDSAWNRYAFSASDGSDRVASVAGDPTPQARLSTTGNDDFRIRIGDALASRFGAIGVDYEPIYEDSVIFFGETITQGSFDLGMWAWVSDGGYASQLRLLDLFDPASVPPVGNFGRWPGGDTVDRYGEIATEARTTADPVRFEELITEAEDILATELPVIPLFSRSTSVAYWSDVVAGVLANGSASDLTWNVENWQRVGE